MSNYPALEVGLGLVFLYIVLALVCTTINEGIATAVGLRARFLKKGLLNLLSASTTNTDEGIKTARGLLAHPLVQGLIHPQPAAVDPLEDTKLWRKPPLPSYIPSRTFVAALTDLARSASQAATQGAGAEAEPTKVEAEVASADQALQKVLGEIPNKPLSEALLALHRSAVKQGVAFELAVEQWYDDSMERVSGWYKRRVHLILLGIAIVVVVVLNADTLGAGRVLWRDPAVRSAVVTQAQASAKTGNLSDTDLNDAVKKLDIPLGWDLSFGNGPTQLPNDALAWLAKLAGLAITIGAVMLGAPFWFDLLGKIMSIRGAGSPPATSNGDKTSKSATAAGH